MKAFFSIVFFISFFFFSAAKAQVTVSGGTLAVGSYSKLKTAIDSINANAVTSSITVNINAGFVDTLTSKIILTATGTSSNIVTIKKNGVGANPILVSYVGTVSSPSSLADGFFILSGSDYVTIDGIDLLERSSNTTATAVMEFGYALMKKNATDGCHHNLIKNCNITLNRIQTSNWNPPGYIGSTGIALLNATHLSIGSLAISNNSGSHSFNKIQSNTIQNCNVGITLVGFGAVSPYEFNLGGYGDSNNEIGGITSTEGNSILNFGGGGSSLAAAGIYATNQWNLLCNHNPINNNNGSGINHANTLRGIYFNGAANANLTCKNNNINLKSASTTNTTTAIENTFGVNGINNTINISNNIISTNAMAATTGSCYGIHHNNSSTSNLNIKNNQIKLSSTGTSGTGLFPYSAIAVTGGINNTIQIDSNTIDTLKLLNNTSTTMKAIYCTGGNNNVLTSISNNNFNAIIHSSANGGSGEVSLVTHLGNPISCVIKNNSASNLSIKSTGTVYFINNSYPALANRTKLIEDNFFENISRTSAVNGGSIFGYSDSGLSDSLSIIDVIGNDFRSISNGISTSNVTAISIASSDTYPKLNISSNQIKNILSLGTTLGISANGIGGTNISPSKIDNNTISKLTGSSNNITGISIGSKVLDCVINNNTIDSITSTNNIECSGINIIGGINTKNLRIYRNKIYEIKGTNTTSLASGINIGSGDSIKIYNNVIGSIFTPNSSSLNAVVGIKIGAANNVELSYNTVYLNATSTATTFGSSALYSTSNFTKLISRNNIFVNTSLPGATGGFTAAYRYLGSMSSSQYSLLSNNNLYYAGVPASNKLLYGETQNSSANNPKKLLLDLKYYFGNGRDSYSVTESPNFINALGSNANFLHINTSIATEIQNGGTPVSYITNDYDGINRNVSTPDIGADEGNFIYHDKTPPIINYTPLNIACDSFDRTLIATMIDPGSGVPQTGIGRPILHWKLLSSGEWQADTSVYISNNNFQFTFGASEMLPNDTIFYYIVAQDNANIPNVGTYPPTNASGYSFNPPKVITPPTEFTYYRRSEQVLNGINFVGTGHLFSTLTSMVSAYQYYCITGPVEFHLTDTVYNVNNVLTLQESPFSSLINTVKIRPAENIIVEINGNVDSSAVFNFSGADFITFDGSNNNSDDKSLTIKNISIHSPIVLKVTGLVNDITNLSFKNLNISSGSTSTKSYGVHVGGSAVESSGNNIKKITFENNNISHVSNGIYVSGNVSSSVDTLVVKNNEINILSTTSAYGIKAKNCKNSNIEKNKIEVESSSATSPIGITLENGFINSIIKSNDIRKVKSSSLLGYGGKGISISTENINSNLSIYNNFISGVNGSNNTDFSNSTSMGIAIGVNGNNTNKIAGGINLYNNSVNLFGTYNNINNCKTSAIFIGSNASNLDIRNNIFTNISSNTSGTESKNYSIYSIAPNTFYSQIDNNNYYVSDTQGVLAFISLNDVTTLSQLKNDFGDNENSLNLKPGFISNTNLHLDSLFNTFLDSAAVNIVTNDIDDEIRNISFPDIGADEFVTLPCSNTVAGLFDILSDSICSNTNYTFYPSIETGGSGVNFQWQKSTTGFNFTNVTSGIGATNFEYTTENLITDTFYYRQRVVCPFTNDTSYSDEFTLIVKDGAEVTISPSSITSCNSSPVSLEANGSVSYSWSPSIGLNNTMIQTVIASPLISTEYLVTGIDSMGCVNYDTVVVSVYQSPLIENISATFDTICVDSSTILNVEASQSYVVNPILFLLKDTSGFANGPFGDDVVSNAINLPFTFQYYNEEYSQIYISTNGLVSFNPSLLGSQYSNTILPSANDPNNIIALCWANLEALQGEISYGSIGISPNRVFVIDFDSVNFKLSSAFVSGQIQLYEADNTIQIHLKHLNDSIHEKTLGIENAYGNLGTSPLNRNKNTWYNTIAEAWEFTKPEVTFLWSPSDYLNDVTLQSPTASNINSSITYTVEVIANGCSSESEIEITTITSPTILSQPESLVGCEESTIAFSVVSEGSNDLVYQWFKDGNPLSNSANITGVNSSILTIQNLSSSDAGDYHALLNCCGVDVISDVAILIISGNTVLNENNEGLHSLRNALECVVDGDTILFHASVNLISLLDPIQINKNVTIYGDTIGDITIFTDFDLVSMANSNFAWKITQSKNVQLENIIIKHNNNSLSKPLLLNEGNLILKNIKVLGNIQPIILNLVSGNITAEINVEIRID